MKMKFGLIALKRFDGSFAVREYCESQKHPGEPGHPAEQFSDLIDESVKKAYPEQYAKFQGKVDAKQEQLFEAAKKAFPNPIFIDLEDEEIPQADKPKKGKKGEGE